MALNTDYMIAPSLQEYFVDKSTGLPLSGGKVYFYSDVNRTMPKAVYTISGSPPNYSYVQLPNPSTLSSVGTFQDEGNNDILPYYFPFDADGNVELYYIEVFDADGVPQLTREAWPNIASVVPDSQGLNATNFIPNGQFLAHNNIPAANTPNSLPGLITQASTNIAQGGWTFERPSVTTAVDYVTFFRYGAYVTDPSSSPRYAVEIQCAGANPSDVYKSLRIKFNDVNKFASLTQEYTFGFNGVTESSGDFQVALNLVKNFGTGGSPSAQVLTQLTTFMITSLDTLFQFSFIFGDNTGKNIGTNNDDFVALDISFPTNLTYNAIFTDFMLLIGNIAVTDFPITTDKDFIARSLVPPPPDPDGYDLYLPLVQTKYGLDYDSTQVGKIYATVSATAGIGELLCNGLSYLTAGYTAEGIPYKRIQNLLIGHQAATFPICPLFGTGQNFVSAFPFFVDDTFISLAHNKFGLQTVAADGAVSTGFAFFTVALGTSNFGFTGYVYGDETNLWILNNSPGVVSFVNGAGTSGFIVHAIPDPNVGERIGSAHCQQLLSVKVNAAPAAGTYFLVGDTLAQFYVWFRIDGVGTDPAPGGTGIRVDLLSTMAVQDIVYVIAMAISAFQIECIQVSAGSAVPPNSYWTFTANSQLYYVWYSLNGGGIDPLIGGGIGISVYYTTSYTQDDMANATLYAINNTYFATPDLRAAYIKGWDPLGSFDLNSIYRYSNNTDCLPNYIGSRGFSMLLNHTHSISNYLVTSGTLKEIIPTNATAPVTSTFYPAINAEGVFQTDVENIYLNYVIKI